MMPIHSSRSNSKQKLATATMVVLAAVNKFFGNPGITEDELLEYIKRFTLGDDSLTNLVCMLFYSCIKDAAKQEAQP